MIALTTSPRVDNCTNDICSILDMKIVSDIAIFVLKRDVKLQLTNLDMKSTITRVARVDSRVPTPFGEVQSRFNLTSKF